MDTITWEERAAIMEYDAGLPRIVAEKLAVVCHAPPRQVEPCQSPPEAVKAKQPMLPGINGMPSFVKEQLTRLYGNW